MDVTDDLRTANPLSQDIAPSFMAVLAGELEQLVERLEAEWSSDRRITRRNAEELHDLRVRAERLLATTNQPAVSPVR